jgi:hypothetical protein
MQLFTHGQYAYKKHKKAFTNVKGFKDPEAIIFGINWVCGRG